MTLLAPTALQSLPDPTIIEALDFEALLTEVKADLIRFAPELASSLELESEPVNKIAQAITYRILHERKLANDQALSLMLAKAEQSQLDHLGSLPFINTPRKTIIPADNQAVPPVPAVMEDDAEYRLRLHIALEGFSTAGPVGAYIYHGLAAHEDIKDIAVEAPTFKRWAIPDELKSNLPRHAIVLIPDDDAGLADPLPGDVAVTVLSRIDGGQPSETALNAVATTLNHDKIRPLTDRPRCRGAEIIHYHVKANIWFYPGLDTALILEEANAKVQAYVEDRQRIGHDVTLSGLHAALHRSGVQRVELIEPARDLPINNRQAGYCLSIDINHRGVAV